MKTRCYRECVDNIDIAFYALRGADVANTGFVIGTTQATNDRIQAVVYWGSGHMPFLEGALAPTLQEAYANLYTASAELLGLLSLQGQLRRVGQRYGYTQLPSGGCYDREPTAFRGRSD